MIICAYAGRTLFIPFAFALLFLTAGCSDEALVDVAPQAEDDLFQRYVALGNSITAGFQSDGINRETQAESYAALVADRMGTSFNQPLLNLPGCPAPLTNPLTGDRVDDALPQGCALRSSPVPRVLNNVAVPGAALLDLFSNLEPESNPNPLTTLVLGGRTQLEAALDAEPTFVSIWIGNNDVLGAAVSGVVTEENVTPPGEFTTRLNQALNELEAGGVEGGVLVGVADVTLIPHLSPGAAYWVAAQGDALPPTFQVADSCAPAEFGGLGEETLVPFGYGFGALLSQAMEGQPVTLDCAEDLQVLSDQEIEALATTIAAYNAALADEAADRGWAFFDPNPTFRELSEEGFIPPFPMVELPSQLFGPVFSLDGVHPGGLGHRLVANGVIEAINGTYGTDLEEVDTAVTGVEIARDGRTERGSLLDGS